MTVWRTDGFTDGTVVLFSQADLVHAHANAAPNSVLGDGREGFTSYTQTDEPAGQRRVRLWLVEKPTVTAAGQRVVDYKVNGVTISNDFDLYQSAGGSNREYVLDLDYTHTGGDAVFSATASAGLTGPVCAIAFLPASAVFTPPGDPGDPGDTGGGGTPSTAGTATQVVSVADSWPGGSARKDFTLNGNVNYWARPSIGWQSSLNTSAATVYDLTSLVVGQQDVALFIPDASATTLAVKDPFVAADGTTLSSPYTASTVGSGTTLTVQSNALRFRTTVGAYGGQARFLTGVSSHANGAAGGAFTLPATVQEGFFYLYTRAPGTWSASPGGPATGVQFGWECNGTNAAIYIIDSDSTILAQANITPVASHRYGFEVSYNGPAVTFRCWDETALQTSATGAVCTANATYQTAGTIQVSYTGGSAAVTNDFTVDYLWAVTGTSWFTYHFSASAAPGGGGGGGGTGTPLPGVFSVSGTSIIDPAGATYLPVGCGVLGPNTWWDRATTGLWQYCQYWGFNTVRMSVNSYDSGIHTNNDLAGLVAEFTSRGIVVIIENHGYTGSYPSGGTLTDLQNWWVTVANQFKANPYVWFNTANELGYEYGSSVSSSWNTVHRAIIGSIRGTGATNIIVVDGCSWGQDRAAGGDSGNTVTGNSGVLTYGPGIVADYSNILFSIHIYDQWNANSVGSAQSIIADYIDRVHAAGLALIVGEAGYEGYVASFSTFHNAFDAVMTVAPARGVGVIAWHGQGVGQGEGFTMTEWDTIAAINSTTAPTNLSHQGQAFWDWTH